MKILTIFFILSTFLYASIIDDASLYREAVKYRTAKQYDKALKILRPLAKKGYDKVQYDLALLYEQGLGVPKDTNASLYWLQKAAKNHNRDALNFLAQKYYNGWGVDVNKSKAKELLLESKEDNSTTAKLLLERYHLNE